MFGTKKREPFLVIWPKTAGEKRLESSVLKKEKNPPHSSNWRGIKQTMETKLGRSLSDYFVFVL